MTTLTQTTTTYGPVELVIIQFPKSDTTDEVQFRGEIIDELDRLVEQGTVRIIDIVVVRKESDGTVTALEVSELHDGDGAALGSVVDEISGLIAEEDVESLSAELDPGTTAGIMLFEHRWAMGFAAAIRRAGGRLIDSARIPAAAVDEVVKNVQQMEES